MNRCGSVERLGEPLSTSGLVSRIMDRSSYVSGPIACTLLGNPIAMMPSESPQVRRLGSLVNQLMSRRGYASATASDDLLRVIVAAIDPTLQSSIQVGNLRQGILHVFATDSVTLQELNFQKQVILKRIQNDLPHAKVTDLRFRIQV